MDLDTPFRGSHAVAAGAITWSRLRGPGFRTLFRDVYVSAHVEVDLALRSRGAYLLVRGRGVLGGYSAAELLGASCGPRDAPAEVVVPGGRQRGQPGLRVSRCELGRGETTLLDGVALTSPVRTAYDLARRLPRVEAVVTVDALAHRHGFAPGDLLVVACAHLGATGSARLPEIVRLADPRAESPMETRIRLQVVDAGLPAPITQHPVGPYQLDLAYPSVRLGMEYDGAEHRTQERAMRDLQRQAVLSSEGWRIARFRDRDVLGGFVGSQVHQELVRIGRDHGTAPDELDLP